jgi:hypothetical protein
MKWKCSRILTNQTFDLLQTRHWLDNYQNSNQFPNQKRQPNPCLRSNRQQRRHGQFKPDEIIFRF